MTVIKAGDLISHYRIIEKIGEGGMGTIYRAEDTALNRQVVLKFLHRELIRDEDANNRFFNEAQMVSRLDHANICKIFEVEKAPDGRMFMAMAYYEGKSLDEIIRHGRKTNESAFTLDEIIDIAIQTARGLEFAHEQGIVHRDIKPANIILDRHKEVKILDFGLAKLKGQTQITREGLSLGTVSYMSPEQAGGETVDQRTDIWSLGVVLYEMLTGMLPFTAEVEMAVIYSILHKSPPALGFTHAGIPAGLKKIIRKAMEKDPGKRYRQIREMLRDLENLRQEEQTVQIDKWKYTPAGKRSPARIAILVTAGVILVAALFLGIRHLFRLNLNPASDDPLKEIRARNSMVIPYFENHTNDPKYEKLGKTISHLLAASLMQSRYVYVLPPEKMTDILRDLGQEPEQTLSRSIMEKLAQQGNVRKILSGRIFKAGEEYRITAQLTDIGSDAVQYSDSLQGSGDGSLFTMADELSKRVKSNLNLSREELAQDIQSQVIKVTTSSQEALQNFIDGKELYFQNRFSDALLLLEKATQLDPDYALAYWYIGQCHNYLGNNSIAPEFLKKALQLSDRLSLRDRYLIQGYSATRYDRDCQKAIDNYKKLLLLYPDDELARVFLGSLYRNMEEWDLALEQFQEILDRNPQAEVAYQNLYFLYCIKGQAEEALQLANKRISMDYSPDLSRLYLARILVSFRKYSEAKQELSKISSLTFAWPLNQLPGTILQMEGEPESASKFFQTMIHSSNLRIRISGHFAMAGLYKQQLEYSRGFEEIQKILSQARINNRTSDERNAFFMSVYLNYRMRKFNKALENINQYIEQNTLSESIPISGIAEFWKALLLIKLNRIGEAQKEIEKMQIQTGNCRVKLSTRRKHFLEGMLFEQQNQIQQAIERFQQALSLMPKEGLFMSDNAFLLENLAQALYKKNDFQKAVKIWEQIEQLTFGREGWEDIPTMTFFYLSRYWETQKENNKSIGYCRKFLAQLGEEALNSRNAIETKELLFRLENLK